MLVTARKLTTVCPDKKNTELIQIGFASYCHPRYIEPVTYVETNQQNTALACQCPKPKNAHKIIFYRNKSKANKSRIRGLYADLYKSVNVIA